MSYGEGLKWWKEAVFYQIYPRSFNDTTGDGCGDILGIVQKLDYIKDLGVDALWISPMYTSPMVDNGYDVSDYDAINPMFGSLKDFDLLVEGLHSRGMKLMMDLVINHTSDQHPWFIESRSLRDNPKRDWYIWRDPKDDGSEPNNWASHFGNSAWKFDEKTGQYYLHYFAEGQPDLNWNNPEVKKEIFAMVKRWLDRGVDGFRMDMANALIKPEGLPDAPRRDGDTRTYLHGENLYANQPGMRELLGELHTQVIAPANAVLYGEMYFLDAHSSLDYVAYDKERVDMMYQYPVVDAHGDWARVKSSVREWSESFAGKAWNTITFSNHDSPRSVSMFGQEGQMRNVSAKMIATYLLTAPGTPFFLQGEELGMTNVEFESINEYTDVEMKDRLRERVGYGEDKYTVFKDLIRLSRDNARTPMQWTSDKNAGFTTGVPWLGVNDNHTHVNVADESTNPHSVLNYYKKMIALRKSHDAFVYGKFVPLTPDDWETYAYMRVLEDTSFIVIVNTSPREWKMERPKELPSDAELKVSNYLVQNDTLENLNLRPWEARVYKVVSK